MKLKKGKLNIIIDGQFGSTGKGLASSYVASTNHVDVAITDSSPNAGHTFYYHNKKYVVKHLPVTGIIHERCQIYLCPGSIINPKILLKEIKDYDIDPNRVTIHPRAAIVTDEDIKKESNINSSVTKIASTQSGVGAALERKINRSAKLAGDIPELKRFIWESSLHYFLDNDCTLLMEVPQGFDLSISSGYSYPHCTSREITVSAALSDAQIHPKYLGKVLVCLRTYPIRVGNITHNFIEVGNSGPFYPDSKEVNWDIIGVTPERTTVTDRVRRVATFSMMQYYKMLEQLQPDYILLNFANYMSKLELSKLLNDLPEVTHLGFGPKVKDVKLNHGYL